jgi:isopentenyl-diphosphate delta-isomerase
MGNSKTDEFVILVDSCNVEVGVMRKMNAHMNGGTLHRAFSVFVFNSKGELLLQKRALNKYHSGGLLTNTCCSHPRPGELVKEAAVRRLQEEMGMTCELEKKFRFEYKAELDNGLTEWELDQVLVGVTDTLPVINTDEVDSYKFMTIEEIKEELTAKPEKFTEWFKICFEKVAISR